MVNGRQATQICPPMIPFCSRFDSVLFSPKMPAIAGCFNFSRSPNLDPIVYFTNYDYVTNSPGQIVTDVANGKIDVALVWGPVGGYFAMRQAVPLLTEALEAPNDARMRLVFPISFGVRGSDKERAIRLEILMREQASALEAILDDNGVPLVDDPAQCARLHQHVASEPTPLVRPVAESVAHSDAGLAGPIKVAQQTSQTQTSESDSIDCKGAETMPDIQKRFV
jgi:hypothetical protein